LGKGKHKRRDRYWQLYDLAQSKELSEVVDKLTWLVDEADDPWHKAMRGGRPVHSPRKMTVICVLTALLDISYRNMETLLHLLKLPWQEPVPGHSTIHEAFKRIPEKYLNQISPICKTTPHRAQADPPKCRGMSRRAERIRSSQTARHLYQPDMSD